MIISRTPFRLSFAGGGTDLAAFYEQEEGAVLSTAVNKYMYITVNDRFDSSIRLSYSHTEICQRVDQIEHPIFRTALQKHHPEGGIELISMADMPAGTGLGSSSSFTVGLLHALKAHKGIFQSAESLAHEACVIEIEDLKEPIGKQDQYIAAYGGLQFIRFLASGEVLVDPVVCRGETYRRLEASCLMFYTGQTRAASDILAEQKTNTEQRRGSLRDMAAIARLLKTELEADRLDRFGSLLDEAWRLKKSVASGITNDRIEDWYALARDAGATGGKILGAGGGGFLMIFCDPDKQDRLKQALSSELRPINFSFERQGSKIIFVGG